MVNQARCCFWVNMLCVVLSWRCQDSGAFSVYLTQSYNHTSIHAYIHTPGGIARGVDKPCSADRPTGNMHASLNTPATNSLGLPLSSVFTSKAREKLPAPCRTQFVTHSRPPVCKTGSLTASDHDVIRALC